MAGAGSELSSVLRPYQGSSLSGNTATQKIRENSAEKMREDLPQSFPGHLRSVGPHSGVSEEASGVLRPRSDLNKTVFEKV